MRMFTIFLNELRRLRKDMALIISLLVIPLALIGPSILSYSSDGEEEGLKGTPLVVANYDGGQISLDLIAELDKSLLIEQNFSGDILAKYELQADARCAQPSPACDEAIGRAQMADKSRQTLLVIPAGLTEAFKAGEQTIVSLLYDPGADAIKATQVEKVCQGLAIKVALTKQIEGAKGDFTDLSSISSPEVRAQIEKMTSKSSLPSISGGKAALQVDEISPVSFKDVQEPHLLESVVPGYATMFVFLLIVFLTNWNREEKTNGLFRRLMSTPIGKADLIGGKMLFGVLVAFVQLSILFALGLGMGTIRGIPFRFDIPAFILLSLVLGASATSLGLLIISTRLPSSLAIAPMFIGALLGGCLIPLDFLPPYLAPLSYLMPQRYGVLGYQDLMMRGGGIPAILPEAGILLLFTIVFFAVAAWRFDPLD